MLDLIWSFMIIISLVCAFATGRMSELSAAATQGADKGIKLILSIAGSMGLWSGIMKVAEKAGLTQKLARFLSPALGRLMPEYRDDPGVMGAVSANITANILGLGNAATPLGIAAVKRMKKSCPSAAAPDRSMIMFIVINTASIQLIPTTAAALRQSAGSQEPYWILPYVWLTSVGALAVGIGTAAILGAVRKN